VFFSSLIDTPFFNCEQLFTTKKAIVSRLSLLT
jgi:hypothetical protein